MATNKIFRENGERNRDRALSLVTVPTTPPTTIQPNTPVVFAEGSAVALTASGGAVVTQTTDLPTGITSISYGNGGVGNAAGHASFAFDGTWEFPVTGATTSTASGTPVYITAAGALTLTEGTNTLYGLVDVPVDYTQTAGIAPVQIGA